MERKVNEAQDLAVIGKMRKGGPKKGMKEQSCYSEMPVEANSIVWGFFLGSCRKHNKVELGEYVAGLLFELDLRMQHLMWSCQTCMRLPVGGMMLIMSDSR